MMARLTKWQQRALSLAEDEARENLTAPRFCEECGRDLVKERGMAYRCPAGCLRPHRAGAHR